MSSPPDDNMKHRTQLKFGSHVKVNDGKGHHVTLRMARVDSQKIIRRMLEEDSTTADPDSPPILSVPESKAKGQNYLIHGHPPSVSADFDDDDDLSLDLTSDQNESPGLNRRSMDARQNVKGQLVKFNPEVLKSGDDLERLVRKVVDWANPNDAKEDNDRHVKEWKEKLSLHHTKFKPTFDKFAKKFGLEDGSENDKVMEVFEIKAKVEMENFEKLHKMKLGIASEVPGMAKVRNSPMTAHQTKLRNSPMTAHQTKLRNSPMTANQTKLRNSPTAANKTKLNRKADTPDL